MLSWFFYFPFNCYSSKRYCKFVDELFKHSLLASVFMGETKQGGKKKTEFKGENYHFLLEEKSLNKTSWGRHFTWIDILCFMGAPWDSVGIGLYPSHSGCLTPEGPRLVPWVPKCCFFSNLLLGDCAASQMWSQPATLFTDVLDLHSPMNKMRIMKARTIHQFLNQIYFHFVCICMCIYHSPYIF